MIARVWLAVAVVAALGCEAAEPRASADPPAAWTIAVISDLHIPRDGSVPPVLDHVVTAVIAARPRVVVVTGDFTDGDSWDLPWRIVEAPGWWRAARHALEPIRAAGIPVLPIAGNHDSALAVYRTDYAEAWGDLDRWAAPLQIASGRQPAGGTAPDAAPFSYGVDVDGVHLSLTHVIDESLRPAVAHWLARDLDAARGANLRIVFGHVPLSSVVAEPRRGFIEQFGTILAAGHASVYVAGHEHLVWDEDVALPGGGAIRQLSVGTASASWRFAPSDASRRRAHCVDTESQMHCRMPHDGTPFELRHSHGRWFETQPHTFMLITIDGMTITARAFAVDERGNVAPFGGKHSLARSRRAAGSRGRRARGSATCRRSSTSSAICLSLASICDGHAPRATAASFVLPSLPSAAESAVIPVRPPSCIDSSALDGTSTIVAFSLSPSYSMFIARRWSAVGSLA